MNYFEKYNTKYCGTIFASTVGLYGTAKIYDIDEEEYAELIKDCFSWALCDYYDEMEFRDTKKRRI